MEPVILSIDGYQAPIEAIWVHFQGADSPNAKPFTLTVPWGHAKNVFDPHGNCPPRVALDSYLRDLISELGTFVVGGYIKGICRLLGKEQGRYQWVIAAVESVEDAGKAIVLQGKVVPFIPGVPAYKQLE